MNEKRNTKPIKACLIVAGVVLLVLAIVFTVNNTLQNNRRMAGNAYIDLTAMSGTMAYATVANILQNVSSHLGDTIRVRGIYEPFFWEQAGRYVHYISVDGVLGCCGARFEFVLSGEQIFPPEGTLIELVGVFSRYTEFGQTFSYLAVDAIVIP